MPKLTVDQKISILSSDSVLIPILVDQSGFIAEQATDQQSADPLEIRRVYLVHLKVGTM